MAFQIKFTAHMVMEIPLNIKDLRKTSEKNIYMTLPQLMALKYFDHYKRKLLIMER